jgi:hypothetical protein
VRCSWLAAISIPWSVEMLRDMCFRGCGRLASVAFETGSRVSYIHEEAFSQCTLLSAIRIPASVKRLLHRSFSHCVSLSRVTFESGSKLSCIERTAGCLCSLHLYSCQFAFLPLLSAFAINASMSASLFRRSRSNLIRNFCASKKVFLANVRHFGRFLFLASMEKIMGGCFHLCVSLSTVSFEGPSKLSRFENSPFSQCSSLSSIYIPSSLSGLLAEYKSLLKITVHDFGTFGQRDVRDPRPSGPPLTYVVLPGHKGHR